MLRAYSASGRALSTTAAAAARSRLATHSIFAFRTHGAYRGAQRRCNQCKDATRLRRHHIISRTAVAGSVPAPPVEFEPHVDGTILAAQLLVLTVIVGAAAYWWYIVVPSARRTLAREKRTGPLNEYLVDLQSNSDKKVERWFYTDWLKQLERRQQVQAQAAAKRAEIEGTATMTGPGTSQQQHQGQQPLSDQPLSTGQAPADRVHDMYQQQDLSDHGDKQPYFWSLDNPILATAAILSTLALLSALGRGVE